MKRFFALSVFAFGLCVIGFCGSLEGGPKTGNSAKKAPVQSAKTAKAGTGGRNSLPPATVNAADEKVKTPPQNIQTDKMKSANKNADATKGLL